MTDEQLRARALEVQQQARSISHPMIPAPVKKAIREAADILAQLVKREVERNAKGE